ncbi:LacI family DNA-binding transcriptional regulator [Luteimicrobium xylanilyticum]|uniref:Sucrose operon repressor n=1 Tax=Luteimicrobium xylanilyticum TaxID=1133546 RepID=A0A5P9QDC2_9MICO|nr:LacI family DNA-binding transcriptional regulator [Luteimicrobium xylanilyticum]QFU99454.1 Sucrose operon repressor [Luteimicrobium xylanilyticum]
MVTVRDVARASGVSISTVSRALSDPTRVAAATRDRVQAAARELGYEPNRAASGLRSGRTATLGVVVPDLENPYFASVAKGVQARAREHGYGVFVVDIEEDASREAEEVRTLLAQTDGVIVASPRGTDREVRELVERAPRGRAVLVNRRIDGVPSVTADDVAGAARALEHLRALGHRRVAYVGGPETSWSDRMRREGLRRAAGAEGAVDAVDLVDLGVFRPHVQGGYSAADLATGAGATAVVAYNDLVALGVEQRLRERGIAVPGQVSVVGFDDTFVATLASPPLTSVGTDLRAVGAAAVDLLVERLTDPDAVASHVVRPTELIVRASTGTVVA